MSRSSRITTWPGVSFPSSYRQGWRLLTVCAYIEVITGTLVSVARNSFTVAITSTSATWLSLGTVNGKKYAACDSFFSSRRMPRVRVQRWSQGKGWAVKSLFTSIHL
jgi:hypothetical protein